MSLVAPRPRALHPGELRRLLTAPPRREERRNDRRALFPFRMRIESIANGRRDPLRAAPEGWYVFGRDLAEAGIGFQHAEPLAFRRLGLVAEDEALSELEMGDLRIEVLVRWCRFGEGGYQSGGQILRSSLGAERDGSSYSDDF